LIILDVAPEADQEAEETTEVVTEEETIQDHALAQMVAETIATEEIVLAQTLATADAAIAQTPVTEEPPPEVATVLIITREALPLTREARETLKSEAESFAILKETIE
jgi:hypothetical protein